MDEDLFDDDDISDDIPIVRRIYCGCEDHGEMRCTGIVLPLVPGRGIEYLCECPYCGYQEIYPMPFPLEIYKEGMNPYGDEDE